MSTPDLTREEQLRLLRFVCAFAWADLEVVESEREMVLNLAHTLGLVNEDIKQVKGWLAHPPAPEDVDPQDVPLEHRQVFLNAALKMVGADGTIDVNEVAFFSLFEKLLH